MRMASRENRNARSFARRYQMALRQYLTHGTKEKLTWAVRLGCQAVSLDLETLDLALIHDAALLRQRLPPRHTSVDRTRMIRRAGLFFAATILPLEETHRTALKSNIVLNRIKQALSQRTQDLAVSTRKLKSETARRHCIEQTLHQREQRFVRLLGQSQQKQEQMRLLCRNVLASQEAERKKISRELHDVVAQLLSSITLRLAVLKKEASDNTHGIVKKIERTQRLVKKSVNIVHQFAYKLRPAMLDYLGLIPALRTLLQCFMQETGIRVSLAASAEIEKLSSAKRTALYRVAQEALCNVARHAKANRVAVSVRNDAHLVYMEIHDDGKSFVADRFLGAQPPKRKGGMGLLGMRERMEMVGGKFEIDSTPGNGTTIRTQAPFVTGVKEHVST